MDFGVHGKKEADEPFQEVRRLRLVRDDNFSDSTSHRRPGAGGRLLRSNRWLGRRNRPGSLGGSCLPLAEGYQSE